MLISYKSNTGIETNTWLDISGGVIIAESTRIITNACFLYFFIQAGVTKPNFDKKKIIIGNSNKTPVARVIDVIVLIYDDKSKRFITDSLIE